MVPINKNNDKKNPRWRKKTYREQFFSKEGESLLMPSPAGAHVCVFVRCMKSLHSSHLSSPPSISIGSFHILMLPFFRLQFDELQSSMNQLNNQLVNLEQLPMTLDKELHDLLESNIQVRKPAPPQTHYTVK